MRPCRSRTIFVTEPSSQLPARHTSALTSPAATDSPPPLTIGPLKLANPVVLAPMAGVTDLPLREMALGLGAGMAVSEMLSSDPKLEASRKTTLRRRQSAQEGIRSVQIVGNEPRQLAEAARRNVDDGADIIDINMGCPAKKVCKKAAGSALLADEQQVAAILDAVVAAVPVPVTLKIRTGISPDRRNGLTIAKIAEQAGIQMLAVHGRTRADRFRGTAEYQTIAHIVDAVDIPVLANGDIDSLHKARQVLASTGAAGVMIGRAAQGKPWLPGYIANGLAGNIPELPTLADRFSMMNKHIVALHNFYGEFMGTRIARKHTGWFLDALPEDICGANAVWKQQFNAVSEPDGQLELLAHIESALSAQDKGVHPGGLAA